MEMIWSDKLTEQFYRNSIFEETMNSKPIADTFNVTTRPAVASLSVPACVHCGYGHIMPDSACPRIRSIAYFPDGSVRRVLLMDILSMWERLPAGTNMGARWGHNA